MNYKDIMISYLFSCMSLICEAFNLGLIDKLFWHLCCHMKIGMRVSMHNNSYA